MGSEFLCKRYYMVTVGNVTEENIKEYIHKQAKESKQEPQQPNDRFKR